MTMTEIAEPVRAVLAEATADGNVVRLPAGQLDRPTYEAVDATLKRMGGRWDRKARGHVFPQPAAPLLAALQTTGAVSRRNSRGDFETPPDVADRLVAAAGLADLPAGSRVLEPSAGRGALVLAALRANPDLRVTAVELDLTNAAALRGIDGVDVIEADFLDYWAAAPFAAVIANPPFHGAAYAKHLRRAHELVTPGGIVTAIVPARYRDRATAAEQWLDEAIAGSGEFAWLPETTFQAAGATVETRLVWWRVR